MTVKEIISPTASLVPHDASVRTVPAYLPIVSALPLLLDSPERLLNVVDADATLLGTVDAESMLLGLGRLITPRDDSSVITLECPAHDYSASVIAHAVEDADAHLVDLLSSPAPEGKIRVTLRVRVNDPAAVTRSLERYGYEVTSAYGADGVGDQLSRERLESLRLFLNV